MPAAPRTHRDRHGGGGSRQGGVQHLPERPPLPRRLHHGPAPLRRLLLPARPHPVVRRDARRPVRRSEPVRPDRALRRGRRPRPRDVRTRLRLRGEGPGQGRGDVPRRREDARPRQALTMLAPRAIPLALPAALVLACVAGCSREGRPGRLQLPADGGVAEPAADPASQFVVALTTLRREASDQARVKAEGGKPPASNTLALLQRGERVTLLEGGPEWARVRASDGAEGFVRASAIAPAASVQEATVLTVAWAFDRPDLLAVNAKRKLDPGTLLFVRKTKDLFTEVDAGSGPSTWVLTDRVTTLPADVAAAKLVEKARHLARSDRKDEAKDVLALLRVQSPDSALVPVLAAELGEAPPAAEAPTGPTAPSGPAPDPAAPTGPRGTP